MDNAPGYNTEFFRDNVAVKFFPPNVTSWKQPMHMGLITALKNRYEYLLLTGIIVYHDLPQDAKDALNISAIRMQGGTKGVDHGKPAILYDAAEYALDALSDLSLQILNNCFIKADIVPALKKYDSSEEPKNFDDLLAVFRNCSLSSRIDI